MVTRVFASKPYLMISWREQISHILIEVSHNSACQNCTLGVDVRYGMHKQIAIPYINLVALV
jgi:hypothetical protein